MTSLRSIKADHRRIRSIITDLATEDPPSFPSMDLLRLLFWNCCEAGNNSFKRNLVEIIQAHKPEIIVLMETKIAYGKMNNFFTRLGFTASSIVNPVDRVGGIWVIWDTNHVNVLASMVSPQAIHTTIHKENYEDWIIAAVYASPNPVLCNQLWKDLEDRAETMDKPWLVAWDFNDYASLNEIRSFSPSHNIGRTQKFLDRVNSCNLIDLGCSGPRMTCTNNRQGLANTMERLDRAMCNTEWRTMFPEATVRVLPMTYSDHSPLVVYIQGALSFAKLLAFEPILPRCRMRRDRTWIFTSPGSVLITAKDHASVQINVGHLDEAGCYTGQFTTFALCGFVRAQGDADSAVDRLWQKKKVEARQQ